MLTQFRSIAHGFWAKLLLALLVLSFAVWGIGDMVRSPGGDRSVAKVGGAPISTEAYQRAVQREGENMRRMLGANYTPELLKSLHPEVRALQTLVQKNLIDRESQALGIVPGDADVVRLIHENPNFRNSKGQFDKELFRAALQNSRISEKTYVDGMRNEIASSLLLNAISVDLPVPDIAVETFHAARDERRNVTLYKLDESLVPLPAPKAEALDAYYEKTAHLFSTPEYRSVSYVLLKPEDAKTDAKVSEEALKAAYNERTEEFKRPERRDVDQLLFSAQAEADKAYGELKSGTGFDQVAKTAAIANKGATALGKVERNKILEAAAADVFSTPKDGFTQPIQSPFGWHIFRVRSIEAASVAPFSEAREVLEKDLKQQALEDAQNNFLNKFEDMLGGGASLQEAAKEFGLKVQSVGPMTQDGKTPDGASVKIPELDKFLETAFKTEEKTESSLMDTKGGLYYVLRVDQVTPQRKRPLEEVRAPVLAAWQKEERAARLQTLATEIGKKMSDKNTRGSAIAQYRLNTDYTGAIKRNEEKAGSLPLSPALAADIFSHAPGESTGAYPLPSGDFAVAVVGERIKAGPLDKETAAAIRQSLAQDARNGLMVEYLQYLQRKYPVWINDKLLQAMNSNSDN